MKRMLIVGLVVTMSVTLFAGSHQDVWVIEDFESYETTADMVADVIPQWPPTGGPWWNLYSLQQILSLIQGGPGDPTPPFPTSITLGTSDPNGFLAFGNNGLEEVPDPNYPKSMILHYEMENSGSVDLLTLASNTGLPVTGPVGALGLMVTDLTGFDKMQFKIKLLSGEPGPSSASTVSFADGNAASIGYYKAERTTLPMGILGASRNGAAVTDEDMWTLIEFDLSAQLLSYDGSPPGSVQTLGGDVSSIIVGIEDSSGPRNVTIAIDDIAFYKESGCPDYLAADINGDCTVDMGDLAAIGSQWLK